MLKRILKAVEAKPHLRLRLYLIGVAATFVLATYGLVTDNERDAWLYLLSALLGMAAKNITPQPPVNDDRLWLETEEY